jgi:VWFA-related protein
MLSLRFPRSWDSRAIPLLFAIAFLFGSPSAVSQANGSPPTPAIQTPADHSPADQSGTRFQLKVRSNLVVVRVVVREAQGKPVEGLRKEDFKLFDRGKEQTITQFDVETSVPSSTDSSAAPAPGNTAPSLSQSQSAAPAAGKFISLYFDDLNISDADMIVARDAADHYLSSNLQPQDRVAIFTSEQILSDFTSDRKQIRDALLQLQPSARSLAKAHYCPDLSDYQALQITQGNTDALLAANDEAKHCEGGVLVTPGGLSSGITDVVIRSLAQNIVSQSQLQARANLHQLEQVVKHMSQMPGQRTVVLVSPGFLSQSEQSALDRLIDHALRAQVVISSLDPKGLAILMREADTTRSYVPATNPATLEAARRIDSDRELVATSVLADVAHGTGGEYFHDNNDLKGGFNALAGSPFSYILAFSPTDLKPDGKFHALKVTLTGKEKGFRVQARRGYFAFENEQEAETQLSQNPEPAKGQATAPDPEVQEQQQIREAVLSKTDMQQMPATLEVKVGAGQSEKRDVSLSAHLETTALHFHKDGEHNLNTITFVFAVFDQKENLLNAQQRRAKVNVLDSQLPEFLKNGVNVNLAFQLEPGHYRLREVVTDSEDHRMTTLSREVTVP